MSEDGNGRTKRARKMPDGAIEHMQRLDVVLVNAHCAVDEALALIRCSMSIPDDWSWDAADWMFRPPEKDKVSHQDPA